MKRAHFYLMADLPIPNIAQFAMLDVQLNLQEHFACWLTLQNWRSGLRILLVCEDQAQAERLDEAMWQFDTEAFLPHNLAGEGNGLVSPVELCWPNKRGNASRDLLINLGAPFPDFATTFKQVIDFVPVDENLKVLARERYKQYRQIGFHLETSAIAESYLNPVN